MSAPVTTAIEGAVNRNADASFEPVVGMLPWPDRFEDFHDRIGISLEAFRDELTGGWLFNYVEAFQRARVQPVLYYFSARIAAPVRFRHRATGVRVCVMPSPRLHCKVRGARYRYCPDWDALRTLESYVSTPLRPLARELRADRCDALLCHEYEYTRFDVAVRLGRLLGIRVFATSQGGLPPRGPIERFVRRRSIGKAGGLVVPSTEEADRVRHDYRLPEHRIALVPNPLDVRRWRPLPQAQVRSELGIPADARVVTWQGRVEIDKKGLDVLFEAWAHVCRAHAARKPLLLLVGSGQDADVLRQLVDAAPPNTVRWIDRYVTDRELLWRYLATADIVTLPSRREGFAVAVAEGMACGLPVVAADAPGVADALGPPNEATGIVVPREDAHALADALGRLIAGPDACAVLGANGRRRAEAYFSLEAVGDRLRGFFWPDRRMQR